VRELAAEILREHGYTVLETGPERALAVVAQHRGDIHLVLTDVIMPGMSGRAVADDIERLRPGTKVLFMSGYTDDTIVHHGVLEGGATLLAKPFRADDLLRTVREVLDR